MEKVGIILILVYYSTLLSRVWIFYFGLLYLYAYPPRLGAATSSKTSTPCCNDITSAYYLVPLPLMTIKSLLTLFPNLYPNLVALIALNIFTVTLMNLRGKKIGIKATMVTSSQ
jgi:hypothetical protein